MANALPTGRGLNRGQSRIPEVIYEIVTQSGPCRVRTSYRHTFTQACEAGVINLNSEGKITSINRPGIELKLPDGLKPEDVLAPELLLRTANVPSK